MRKPVRLASLSVLVLALVQVVSVAAELQVPIQVSPNTLVLHSRGDYVTVHADIAFGRVATETLTLNAIPASSAFADSCGNLVVKFDIEEVKNIAAPPEVVLTLAGDCRDGVSFEGSATITVRE